MHNAVRIGMVNFINTAPIHEVWRERTHPAHWRMVEAPPSTLNRLLAEGGIDVGFVSSHEYAQRPQGYRIMADLSISASGPVGSVLLFSRLPLTELSGAEVRLSAQSGTSNALVRILLEDFFQQRPCYRDDVCGELSGSAPKPAAILAIGDEALRLRDQAAWPVVLDLADEWRRWTGLPFVFAVFALREDFLANRPAEARAVHGELLVCRAEGLSRLEELSRRAAARVPMDEVSCLDYLRGIEYDLAPAKLEGLTHFFAQLIRRGEADAAALPLKMFP
ncbi:MAG: ABC transporter substrate-binding protein [Desulfobulbaceae bacterium A2]|nr:MAG: ABC transporter substrate-binding protein [Desulfobulbaceae bacterium A2]